LGPQPNQPLSVSRDRYIPTSLSRMSSMGEGFYSTLSVRPDHHADFTPYSAVCFYESFSTPKHLSWVLSDSEEQVSSFNIPYSYDDSLNPPSSFTQSLTVDTKSAYCSPTDMEVKLSPPELSPSVDLFSAEEEHPSDGRKSPMRYKDPHRRLHISTSNSSYPNSPCIPSPPYFGSYGVSATPSLVPSESSPTMNQSPKTLSTNLAGGSSSDSRHTRLPTPTQTPLRRPGDPIRIAPNPPSMEPSLHNDPFRQNSLAPLHSLGFQGAPAAYKPYSNAVGGFPGKNHRKRKASGQVGEILLSGDMTFEEQILMQLTEVDRLPWKEVAIKFKERTGKDMRVPALQMRKKRLMERLRVWTPTDVHNPLPLPHRQQLYRPNANSSMTGTSFASGYSVPR